MKYTSADILVTIGKNLGKIQGGQKQIEFAKTLKIDQGHLSEYLSGKKGISLERLAQFANATGASPASLISETDQASNVVIQNAEESRLILAYRQRENEPFRQKLAMYAVTLSQEDYAALLKEVEIFSADNRERKQLADQLLGALSLESQKPQKVSKLRSRR